MELNLQDKTALVTGGSHGIGKAIKEGLEKEGCKVINWDKEEGIDLLKEIPNLPDIDILINNVGGYGSVIYHEYQMMLNYKLPITLTYQMMAKRKDKGGVIIGIGSIYGKEAGHSEGFTASKSAQIAFMKTMSRKYDGFRFNVVCPGHIDVGKPFPDNPKIIGKPEDVANLVVFLCSEKASHINGAVITVDGGASHSF